MKYGLHFICFLMSLSIYAQKVNDYKYVVVPDKYEIMKTADQHQINTLSKFLLEKYGFEAYLGSDEKPFNMEDAACAILYADLQNDSNFIQTRVSFILKDCKGKIIFKTIQGRSKKKDYKPAYHEALRNAFEDIKDLQYRYNGKSNEISQPSTNKKAQEIKEPANTIESSPEVEIIIDTTAQKEETVVNNPTPTVVDAEIDSNKPILYASEDGFYRAVAFGNSITIYEKDDAIGSATVTSDDTFLVATSQFEGTAYFKEGRLIIDRKIKGVVGKVQMIFTKQ